MPSYLDYHGLETLKSDLELLYLKNAKRGASNGVASLNENGKVPASQLPDTSGLPSGGTTGQVLAKASDADNDVEWSDAGAIIDDTAGDGDTDKVWSADKMTDELQNVLRTTNLNGLARVTDHEGAVCSVGYEVENSVVKLKASVPFKQIRNGIGISDLAATKPLMEQGEYVRVHHLYNSGVLDVAGNGNPGELVVSKCTNAMYSNPENPQFIVGAQILKVVDVDDTAGDGDTDKIWSADKTKSYVDTLFASIATASGVSF